jgi:hypothetical protein
MITASPGTATIGNLKVDSGAIALTCTGSDSNPCQWMCNSDNQRVPDGTYTITFSAPGYEPQTREYKVANPTNCGCCGCCPWSGGETIALVPNGQPITGCCANVQTSNHNCGQCGRKCALADTWQQACDNGKCLPALKCINEPTGFANCNEMCTNAGQKCMTGCGSISGTKVSAIQWGEPCTNAHSSPPKTLGCTDPLMSGQPVGFASFACCCGEP